MKKLFTLLCLALACCTATAASTDINLKTVIATTDDTNHFLLSVGNVIRRMKSTNVFEQIKPDTARFDALVVTNKTLFQNLVTNRASQAYFFAESTGGGGAGFYAHDQDALLGFSSALQGFSSTNLAQGILYFYGGFDGTVPAAAIAPTGAVFYGHISTASNLVVSGASMLSAATFVPSALAYVGTNCAINAALANTFRLTMTGNTGFTISGGMDGQTITLQLTQDGTGNRTAALTNLFTFGSDITGITLTTNAGRTDYLRAQYWSASNRWDVLSFIRGY